MIRYKEEESKIELRNYLEILIRSSLREALRNFNLDKRTTAAIHASLKGEIENYLNSQEYFDEQEFVDQLGDIIERALNSCRVGNQNLSDFLSGQNNQPQFQEVINSIFNSITEDKDGKRVLRANWLISLTDFFRKSPEKKGTNFRDQIKDKEELRAFLYLCLTDESEKQKFRQDFGRALNQGEPIFYKLWPPSIANVFRALIGSEPKPKGFNKGEFMRSIEAYLEDISQGKDRITLWFEESLLPDELKDKNPEELQRLGVRKINGQFEIYFNSDQYWRILNAVRETYVEGLNDEIKVEKLLKEVNDLFNELKKESPSKFQHRINAYGSILTFYVMGYQRAKSEEGLTSEQLNNLIEELNKFKAELNELKKDIEEYKSEKNPDKKDAKFKEIMARSGKFLLNAGKNLFSFISLSLAAWGIALGWFLPLWLIGKMYEQLEKGPFGKK